MSRVLPVNRVLLKSQTATSLARLDDPMTPLQTVMSNQIDGLAPPLN